MRSSQEEVMGLHWETLSCPAGRFLDSGLLLFSGNDLDKHSILEVPRRPQTKALISYRGRGSPEVT